MGAKVKNPRKKFLWSIMFPKHPINTYLFQTCTLPDVEIDQAANGDVNRDVKTPGRVSVGNLIVEKLMTTAGSDTWLHDWLYACQDMIAGGGLPPAQIRKPAIVNELAEDGVSVLNTHIFEEVWPCKVTGLDLDRMASENTIESIEFSVGTADKY